MMSPRELSALSELLQRTPMTGPEALFVEGLLTRFADEVERAVKALQDRLAEQNQAKTEPSKEDRADMSGLENRENQNGPSDEPSRP